MHKRSKSKTDVLLSAAATMFVGFIASLLILGGCAAALYYWTN